MLQNSSHSDTKPHAYTVDNVFKIPNAEMTGIRIAKGNWHCKDGWMNEWMKSLMQSNCANYPLDCLATVFNVQSEDKCSSYTNSRQGTHVWTTTLNQSIYLEKYCTEESQSKMLLLPVATRDKSWLKKKEKEKSTRLSSVRWGVESLVHKYNGWQPGGNP